ncbi:MAG: HD domain-containing protein [Thermoprotei archaeon]
MDVNRLVTALKNLVRTGWMQRGIPPSLGETVAEHSFEAAVIAYYLSTALSSLGIKADPNKAAVLALFHDAGEAILGDLPKWATERLSDKRKAEVEANELLGTGQIFSEYKSQETIEAKIARLSDRLSTLLQAYRYRKMGFDVSEIIESYQEEVERILSDLPDVRPIVEKLVNDIKSL